MRPRDFEPGDDPDVYLEGLQEWEDEQQRLLDAQEAAAEALIAAQARQSELEGLLNDLAALVAALDGHRVSLDANAQRLAALDADVARADGVVRDHEAARALATGRLLDAPPAASPLVLLPVRLQTRWIGGVLHVRIYPDDVSVDAHDPRLTTDEQTWGEHFWAVHAGDVQADDEETWQQLVRRFGAPRAAWVVKATAPTGPPPAHRDDPWPAPASVRLLPDRFAVVALSGGEPVDVGPAGGPPRFVTWSRPVPGDLPVTAMDDATSPWWRDLATARDVGMAVEITPPPGHPPMDTLVAVGVRRSGARPGDRTGLAALLASHAVSAGLAALPDGAATNNSSGVRSEHSPAAQERAARAVSDAAIARVDAGGAPAAAALPPGSGGHQLAVMLGLPDDALAAVAGTVTDRVGLVTAARLLVGLGTRGALRSALNADGVWPLVQPSGHAPSLRVGRQPYGVLPATAPARWAAARAEPSAGLATALQEWGQAVGPAIETDPGDPPRPAVGTPVPLRVTRDDDSDLPAVLLEAAGALAWAAPAPDGTPSPATGVAALVPRIVAAARRAASGPGADPTAAAAVDGAAQVLDAAAPDDVAPVVTGLLDAVSHRFDAWVSAAVHDRLTAQRLAEDGTKGLAVGAFGVVTDVARRDVPRSAGHVHAPSLAHAATAAVLRSGFLGERRRAWQERAASADTEVAKAEALASAAAGVPLDDASEQRLPLAVDLSSRRLRGALQVLAASRAGQPLAAVLGHGFERDLADASLLAHLGAFRKLTRFRSGSALDALEQRRSDARDALAAAQAQAQALQAEADDLAHAWELAEAERVRAQKRADRADALWEPFRQIEEVQLPAAQAEAAAAQQALTHLDAARPEPVRHPFHVHLP